MKPDKRNKGSERFGAQSSARTFSPRSARTPLLVDVDKSVAVALHHAWHDLRRNRRELRHDLALDFPSSCITYSSEAVRVAVAWCVQPFSVSSYASGCKGACVLKVASSCGTARTYAPNAKAALTKWMMPRRTFVDHCAPAEAPADPGTDSAPPAAHMSHAESSCVCRRLSASASHCCCVLSCFPPAGHAQNRVCQQLRMAQCLRHIVLVPAHSQIQVSCIGIVRALPEERGGRLVVTHHEHLQAHARQLACNQSSVAGSSASICVCHWTRCVLCWRRREITSVSRIAFRASTCGANRFR